MISPIDYPDDEFKYHTPGSKKGILFVRGMSNDQVLLGAREKVIHSPFTISSDLGSKAMFFGVDNPDHLRGLSDCKVAYMNELNLFDKSHADEVYLRLRGEAGQKVIADWNPVDQASWVKTDLIDLEVWHDASLIVDNNKMSQLDGNSSVKINDRKDMVLIKTTYLDNRWMTGSEYEGYGFKDVHAMRQLELLKERDTNRYRVFALGEWGSMRVEDAFWVDFSEKTHVRKDKDYADGDVIHLTVDINRLPYISQCLWTYKTNDKEFVQFNELLAKTPSNEAERAADMVVKYLDAIGYKDVIFLYGDASGNNQDAKDNRSFFTVYRNRLIKHLGQQRLHDMIWRANPSISASAAFVNYLYSGQSPYRIYINPRCHESICDYSIAEKDKDGKMLKKKVKDRVSGHTIEPNGHISDAKRYFITKVLEAEYKRFIHAPSNRIF